MMQTSYTALYRPVGKKELELIISTGWKAFPPRLNWQPIFYPVLNPLYAEEIITAWNLTDPFSGHCGFVTEFSVDTRFLAQYETQNVGDANHNELWVPAGQLPFMNAAIHGHIRVINRFYGKEFDGQNESGEALATLDSLAQVATIKTAIQQQQLADLVRNNFVTIYLNIGFWENHLTENEMCTALKEAWQSIAEIVLPLQ